jgi:hypothetical protein
MRLVRVASCIAIVIAFVTPGRADPPPDPNRLPSHADVCEGNKVDKNILMSRLLDKVTDASAQGFRDRLNDPALQSRFFANDSTICGLVTKAKCSASPKDCGMVVDACQAYQHAAIAEAQEFFKELNRQATLASPAYTEGAGLRNHQPYQQVNAYFAARGPGGGDNSISCSAKADIPPAPTPPKPPAALDNVRVRAKSDDLYISRTLQQLFKSTAPASVNWTGSNKSNYTAKFVGAVGYELGFGDNGQLIPYVSFNQSLTDASNKPRVIDPTNSVAGGFLLTNFFLDGNITGLTHVVTLKPEYLENTADRSQIARMRVIYAPWSNFQGRGIDTNTFHMVPFLPGPTWIGLIVDVRNDSGFYTNRGNTPAIVAVNKDFDRIGSRFGLSLSTDNFPSLTATVTETYLYGIEGFYRHLDLLTATVTYNFESNNYFGVTGTYTHGRDEDTAVAAQTWTLGLTVRY